MFATIQEVKQYIHVSKYLDIEILRPYIASAKEQKVEPYLSKALIDQLEDSSFVMPGKERIYEAIRKAVANYAVALAIPFIKMHLSSAGANSFADSKMDKSPWYDVRDYGLSAIAQGDLALSFAVEALSSSPLAALLPHYDTVQESLFHSPQEVEKLYPIGHSYELYLKLLPLLQDAYELYLTSELSPCLLADITAEAYAVGLLKRVVGYYALADATLGHAFTFTLYGMVLQWEQLPWQKSALYSAEQLRALREDFLQRANKHKQLLIDYIKKNPGLFPCYRSDRENSTREPLLKKSGIYF